MKKIFLFTLFIVSSSSFAFTCQDYNSFESALEKKAFLYGTVQKLKEKVQFKAVRFHYKALSEFCTENKASSNLSERLDKLPAQYVFIEDDSDAQEVKRLFHYPCYEVAPSNNFSSLISRAFQAGTLLNKNKQFKKDFDQLFFNSCLGMESLGPLTLSTITTLEEKSNNSEEVSDSQRNLPSKEAQISSKKSDSSKAQSKN